jgi:hypothetical protein
MANLLWDGEMIATGDIKHPRGHPGLRLPIELVPAADGFVPHCARERSIEPQLRYANPQ